VHSRVTAGVPWDAAYEPMGLRLARLVPARRTWALDVRYRDGASWTCETAEPRSCGVRPFRGAAAALVDGLPRVTLFPSRREGHDGVYDVGPLHPSRPAAAQPPPAGAPGAG